jgi:hypothetical protein
MQRAPNDRFGHRGVLGHRPTTLRLRDRPKCIDRRRPAMSPGPHRDLSTSCGTDRPLLISVVGATKRGIGELIATGSCSAQPARDPAICSRGRAL